MGAPEKSQANASNSMQRVKVYRLNDDGKWDDQGTGHVSVDYMERSEELGLFVVDEEDNETLLLHRISSDDIYRKQEDTIISWRDPEYSTELALSFQETTGCTYIWDNICNVQRNLHFNTLNNDTFHSVNSELRELPAVELSTLPLILKTVAESGIADQMRLTELIGNDQEFFRKLMDLFRICEELENVDGLHMIYKIVKGIILLNSPQIFEKIFGDELIMDIIGALEYDPEVPRVQHHRNFLKEHVVYKEAIPIKDPLVLSKIHQTYRVGYLKDVVLARVLDEGTIANLNSIIHGNNALVVSMLKDDSTFIQELFARLRSPSTPAESKKNLVYFLHEFCSLSKSLQMVQQLRLFRDLMNEGIFDIITDALQSQDKRLVLTGTDILILFLNQDPNLLRSYVVRQEGILLFGLLVKGMITDFEEDMHCQFLEILRSLLDSYTLSGAQRDTIIEIFYEKHLGQLIDVITASCPSESGAQSSDKSEGSGGSIGNENCTKPEILSNICELLCFCVLHHPYRIKCNFLLNNVIDKVLLLTRRRERYLVVAAVRFVRTILSRSDEHLISHIVKNNLLKPIVDAFVSNGNRYNLLNSAVLELFEYIRKENLKLLLKYIVDSFWDQLAKFENLVSIQSLKVKYEQSLENCGTKGTGNVSENRKRIDERALEKEEEDYFNEDSDEEDTASASMSHAQKVQSQPVLSNGVTTSGPPSSPRSGGLVDYEDDEDDEDYRPPPRKQPETSEEVEGTMEALRLKRKLASKDNKPEVTKKQRFGKNSRSKDNVFAALCTTLSQAVLPSKKIASTMHGTPHTTDGNQSTGEENHQEKPATDTSGSDIPTTTDENHKENELAASRICSDRLHSNSDSRQLGGEESPLIPSNSSSEMAVNGS
ncbi:serine/threonine-protein phosphatase 4 regulatory subunit 3-like isoform X1 [Quercus lobata]|uniref:Serine/threonine-protein phosphatase 4 regulatory subunit 3-like central domain-containing protein n=1 Tax=Quercus lobata TaxID=97700 RepID=A0A7N2R660_QUELO|nr:serine/threonine-protein phosphatase 4 regulatory subunit 3-like isoform X1 [Quercus lobata]